MYLKSVVLALLVCMFAGTVHANIILNGDFENNTAGSSKDNLSNADFNIFMANATAFGTSEEIDIYTGTYRTSIAPQSGNWKLGLHNRNVPGNPFDGFSLDLANSITAGVSYDLVFFAAGYDYYHDPLVPVQVGLSNSATDFGTLLYAGMPTSAYFWTQFNFSFIAPSDASFLTVRTDPSVADGYAFVDNFSLDPVPIPGAVWLLGSGLIGLVGLRKKLKK
jgi:hypothetical protein